MRIVAPASGNTLAAGAFALVAAPRNPENGAMSDATSSDHDATSSRCDPLARLRAQLLVRWSAFPQARKDELDALLGDALERAAAANPEVLTVMDPASRPQRLRLATVVEAADLDSFYHNEWAEMAISDDGRLFLVYRRRDGGDYAVTWSHATTVPVPVMQRLPDVLAIAMLESDSTQS